MTLLQDWRRQRALQPWIERRGVVLKTILELAPAGTPYWYDAALSFLQTGELDLVSPARLDLFFHDPDTFHLAVDVLGPESRPHYREAARFISRSRWEQRRSQIEYRAWMLAQFHCPYLVVTDDESVDVVSLASRLRLLVPNQEIALP